MCSCIKNIAFKEDFNGKIETKVLKIGNLTAEDMKCQRLTQELREYVMKLGSKTLKMKKKYG